ncbi:MAG: hypothetical protein US49_C0006G0110 [candidate division TM6 bacterium GW2011_GWF2_37_49]|nr:MAG: hypothetical protein US49_C0006G0110 [candidate division TM6 bacterium GW2011_GWF2_37_49]
MVIAKKMYLLSLLILFCSSNLLIGAASLMPNVIQSRRDTPDGYRTIYIKTLSAKTLTVLSKYGITGQQFIEGLQQFDECRNKKAIANGRLVEDLSAEEFDTISQVQLVMTFASKAPSHPLTIEIPGRDPFEVKSDNGDNKISLHEIKMKIENYVPDNQIFIHIPKHAK